MFLIFLENLGKIRKKKCGQFAWNVKSSFMGKKIEKYFNMPSAEHFTQSPKPYVEQLYDKKTKQKHMLQFISCQNFPFLYDCIYQVFTWKRSFVILLWYGWVVSTDWFHFVYIIVTLATDWKFSTYWFWWRSDKENLFFLTRYYNYSAVAVSFTALLYILNFTLSGLI